MPILVRKQFVVGQRLRNLRSRSPCKHGWDDKKGANGPEHEKNNKKATDRLFFLHLGRGQIMHLDKEHCFMCQALKAHTVNTPDNNHLVSVPFEDD